jgi:hypothetical protein
VKSGTMDTIYFLLTGTVPSLYIRCTDFTLIKWMKDIIAFFLPLGAGSCCASIQLVPCDAVNRNKVFNTSTRLYFSSLLLHVSASTGHPQVRYTIGCFNGLPSNATDPLQHP